MLGAFFARRGCLPWIGLAKWPRYDTRRMDGSDMLHVVMLITRTVSTTKFALTECVCVLLQCARLRVLKCPRVACVR